MKRTLSVILSFCLLLTIICETSAFSLSYDNAISNYELSIIRIQSDIFKYSKSETAKKILKKIGMTSGEIDLLSEDNYNDIINAESIVRFTEYCKVSSDGTEEKITAESFEKAVSDLEKTKYSNSIKSNNEYSYSGSDGYFIKNLYVYKTLNAPSGTYGIIGTFDWKNFTLAYKGTDVLSLSGEGLIFNKSSFSLAAQFSVEEILNGNHTHITETDYITSSSHPNNITQSGNAIACEYALPHNLSQGSYSHTYSDAVFLMTCSSRLQYYTMPCTFNVYCNYFHQWLVISTTLSISVAGASVSVKPSLAYWNRQIATSSPISYTP